MLNNNAVLRYEIPYKCPFEITKCWTNGTITLQYGASKIRYNILRMNLNVGDINFEN